MLKIAQSELDANYRTSVMAEKFETPDGELQVQPEVL
jgi:hypothetical protein